MECQLAFAQLRSGQFQILSMSLFTRDVMFTIMVKRASSVKFTADLDDLDDWPGHGQPPETSTVLVAPWFSPETIKIGTDRGDPKSGGAPFICVTICSEIGAASAGALGGARHGLEGHRTGDHNGCQFCDWCLEFGVT